MAPREITVSPKAPMPQNYAFLAKGIPYKTLHCRRLTHEARKPLYVVEANKKVLGIRVPKHIFFQVQSMAKETLSSRRDATAKRDATQIRSAAEEIERQFSRIPEKERELVLKHGFKKHSGRVGRTGQMPIERKVFFAVVAHIRHKHTQYDELLREGADRDEARRAVQRNIQKLLKEWGAQGDFSWYFDRSDDDLSE